MNDELKKNIVNKVKNKLMKSNNNMLYEDITNLRQALDLLLSEDLSFTNVTKPTPQPSPQKSQNTQQNNTQPIRQQMPENMGDSQPMISSKITDMLNKMRAMALEGVKELADNSTSEEYIFFKKVWDMCDKAQEAKKNGEQKPSNNP